MLTVCVCVQKHGVQMKTALKDSQWYDVGIVKVTNMVVTHYYVPYDGSVMDVSSSPRRLVFMHLMTVSGSLSRFHCPSRPTS